MFHASYFNYLVVFFIAALLTAAVAWFVRRIAARCGIVDFPDAARKIQKYAVPLLGGLAPFFVFVGLVVLLRAGGMLETIPLKHLVGIIAGSFLLMIGGALDDARRLPPIRQILWPLLATLVVIASGIGIRALNNPFGGSVRLDQWEWIVAWLGKWPYRITLFADLFTLLWLMGMMYTTKFLDGLDGLVAGITVIGALLIAAVSVRPPLLQTDIALLALVGAGAFAGFLLWNWHPAKIFLGEGGALFAGFFLGTLAILSVSKVAVTLLVFGIPILDVAWVLLRRVFWERRSPFRGDDQHLHFRLLHIGLSHRQAVAALLAISAAFGSIGLLADVKGKAAGLLLLALFLCACGALIVGLQKKKHPAR